MFHVLVILNFMKITESDLRNIIKKQIRALLEDAEQPPKAGKQGSEAEGTLDVKKIADTLGLDASKLKTAVTNIRKKMRNSNDNAVFGDMIAKLIDASPDDTVKVMTVLKKVSAEEGN